MVRIYEHYFEELEESAPKLLNFDFVITFISSPYRATVKNLKNAYAIKIYFTHITSRDSYSYIYAWDGLSAISLGHLFNKNTRTNLTKAWEDSLDKEYNYTKEFNVNLEEDTKYMTLKEVYKTYGFFKKLLKYTNENKEIGNEFLAVYSTDDGNKIIIPCMVLIQAFYTKSRSNSLFDGLLHPNGIKSMVKSCEYQGQREGLDDYLLKLDGKSHMVDIEMLFYFSVDKIHTEYFNQVGYQIQNKEYVKSAIPKKEGSLNIKAEYIRISPNTFFIRNILQSNLINDVTKKFSFEFEHPKSKKKKNRFDKRNPDYDIFQENSDTNGIVDDSETASANDTDIIVSAEGINLASVGDSTFNSRQLKRGQEEDRGGRIHIIHTDKEKHK